MEYVNERQQIVCAVHLVLVLELFRFDCNKRDSGVYICVDACT